ncbi:membrane-associated protein, putative [Bodo saltans]|uniref:Membrane-associated protein, putative n=1 Tax=Bodo saltans TaxID=75058 RepID=A0A0S4JCG6_BODSA|nr:membrane-associated protein, putative [Bodo saltans]|eukprot:CUG86594.1 membrane-associated protein, putative [Bodo saltans]
MSTHKSFLHAVLLLLLWCSMLLCCLQPCHGALPPPPGLPDDDTLTKSSTMSSNTAPNQRGDEALKEGNTAQVSFTTPICPQVPLCHHITPSSSSQPISSHLCTRASGGRAMLRHGVTATKKILSTAVNALLSSASFLQEGGHRWFSKTVATSSSEETPQATTQQLRKTSYDPDVVHSQFILHSQKFILRNLHELLLEGHAPNPTARQAILSFISWKLRRITSSFSATGGGDELRPACATNPSPPSPPGNPELPCSGSSKKKHEEEDEEEVLFLVGDNGVGKTHVARLISLAWSLHCAEMPSSLSFSSSPPCEYGDALLWLSGTSFAGSSPASAAQWIQQQICSHGRQFPFGIVLLDDVSAFPSEVLPFLAPLLGGGGEGEGGGGTFESCTDVPLEHLLVIMTSDFGTQQHGRRRQHNDDEGHSTTSTSEYAVVDSDEELMQLIPKEFKFASRDAIAVARSSSSSSSCSEKRSEYCKDDGVDHAIDVSTEAIMSRRMTIVPFRSWSLEDAKAMISTYVQRTFGCSRVDFAHHQYQDLQFVPLMTDSAIDFVLRLVGSSLWAENGHAVTRVLRTSLDTVVLDAIEAEVAIDEQGTLGLVIDGVVGAPNSEEGGPQIAQRLSIRFVPL